MRESDRPRGEHAAGIAASLAAEAVFIALVASIAGLRGKDPWGVTRVPASFLLGPEAIRPPGFVPGDVGLGIFLHLALGVLVGVLYAVFLPRLGVTPIAGGLIAGGVLYALGFWLLPILFPDWLAPFWLPPDGRALQALAHVVYGVVFGLVYERFR
jgi:hypothetical protein